MSYSHGVVKREQNTVNLPFTNIPAIYNSENQLYKNFTLHLDGSFIGLRKNHGNTTLFLQLIKQLSREEGFCYATNVYFSNIFTVAARTIQRWLEWLEEAKLIEKVFVYVKKPFYTGLGKSKHSRIVLERRIYPKDTVVTDATMKKKTGKTKIAKVIYVNTLCRKKEEDKTHGMWRWWRRGKKYDKYGTFEPIVYFTDKWGKTKEKTEAEIDKEKENKKKDFAKKIAEAKTKINSLIDRDEEKIRNHNNYRTIGASLYSMFSQFLT